MASVPEGVRATASSAASTKARCARLGYFREAYERAGGERPTLYELFDFGDATGGHGGAGSLGFYSNQPLINRGTFARAASVRSVVMRFIETASSSVPPASAPTSGSGSAGPTCQVVSLGAGMDALPFDLHARGMLGDSNSGCTGGYRCRYIEIDAVEIVRRKANAIMAHHERLFAGHAPMRVSSTSESGSSAAYVIDGVYGLAVADVMKEEELRYALRACGFDERLPTLFVMECLLVYWKRAEADALLRTLATACCAGQSAAVVYEQVRPGDAYGTQMMRNLRERGCPLLGVSESPSQMEDRLREAGWTSAAARDMLQVWDSSGLVPPEHRRHACSIEPLDEVEEWNMIQRHYALAVGSSPGLSHLIDVVFGSMKPCCITTVKRTYE